jgi:hypothetical protein
MDSAEMVRRLQAARQRWHELDDPPRRALLIRRPAEVAMMRWRERMTPERIPEMVIETVVDWRGFTEADFLGAGVGASDPQAFSSELFAEWVNDNADALGDVAETVFTMINEHSTAREKALKN